MSVLASPEHVLAIPNQLPVEPLLAPNPPELGNDYLDAVDYDDEEEPSEDLDDEEEDPKENLEMDLDKEEEDLEMDVDDGEEEEEQLPASHHHCLHYEHHLMCQDPLLIMIFLLPLLQMWVHLGDKFVIELDIPELMNDSTATRDRLTLLEQDNVKDREEIQNLKNQELRYRLTSAEIRLEVASVNRYRLECELYNVRVQMHAMQQELYWRGFEENCPTESIDVLATYGDVDPPEQQEPSDTQ
nr:S-adenosyl-L-methionine-dependent methyltransferase [Tanacetum cinerariifolium]